MNSTRARIVALTPDGTRAFAEVDAAAACPRCASGRGCGAGLFAGRRGLRRVEVQIAPGVEVAAGDTVLIDVPGAGILAAAAIVYGLPLAGAALAAAIAYLAGAGDATAALGAVAAAAAAFIAGRRYLVRSDCLERLVPTVSGRVAGDRVAR